jgi:protein involved in polysaccharide export with SLBB domain
VRAARALLLVFVLLVPRAAWAQLLPDVSPDTVQAPGVLPPTLDAFEGPIDPKTYRLGPGDHLMLEVLGSVTMRFPLVVDPEGNIWIPDKGSLPVAGKTLEQARAELQRQFKGGARGLSIHLRLTNMRHIVVYVGGEVVHPGAIEATPATRVSEAIRLAGGFTSRSSQRNIEVRGDSNRTADLVRFLRIGDRDANPTLEGGDRVIVPVAHLPIFLHAPVPYPGAYEARPGETLKDLVATAGGLLPTAIPGDGRVLRFRDALTVDTLQVDVSAGITGSADIPLEEGDRVYIPATNRYHEDRSVTVRGEVVHPGTYPIEEGRTTVSEALTAAGGLTTDASRSGILVVRPKSATLERDPEYDRLSRLGRSEMTDKEYQTFRSKLAFAQTTFRVDLGTEGAKPDTAALRARDVVVEHGDVVVVERKAQSVEVAGEVKSPGLVQFVAGRSGEDYIELVGGYGKKARKGSVRVTRVATGQTMLLKDVHEVEAGDLIYVPEKKDINWFGVLRDVVALAASIATVYVIARD